MSKADGKAVGAVDGTADGTADGMADGKADGMADDMVDGMADGGYGGKVDDDDAMMKFLFAGQSVHSVYCDSSSLSRKSSYRSDDDVVHSVKRDGVMRSMHSLQLQPLPQPQRLHFEIGGVIYNVP